MTRTELLEIWQRQLRACTQSDQLLQEAVESSQRQTNRSSLSPSTEGQSGRSPSPKIPPMGQAKTRKLPWNKHRPSSNPRSVVTQQPSSTLSSRWNQQLKREASGGEQLRPIETRSAASRSRSEKCLPLSEADCRTPRCLIIADGSDADIRQLLKDAGHETHFLSKNEDAIEAITSLLKKQQQENRAAQSLHIVAHGRAGAVNLGSQEITSNTLIQKAECLGSWNISSIKLWSCETGQDTDFVNLLSTLTNADVYCSKTSINAENNNLSTGNQDNQTSLKELVPANNIREWQGQLGLVAGTAPTTGWSDLLAADIYDPNDDHQASAIRFDLVGDANNPLLQAQQEDVTIAGNPETAYWFRADLAATILQTHRSMSP